MTLSLDKTNLAIEWELLPADYILPDDPVDNDTQPLLAEALREGITEAQLLKSTGFIATNFGICLRVAGKFVIKAPDWVWVQETKEKRSGRRSYTPHREGDLPQIVMEFLSETDGGEYSVYPNFPYGKWYYYEQLLKVPYYCIFEPETGHLECYVWKQGHYQPLTPNEQGLFWIETLDLFLGVWQGERAARQGYWLRWWNASPELLLWGNETAQQERLKAEQSQQIADQALQELEQERLKVVQALQEAEQQKQQAQRLAEKLRELGVDPNG